MEVNKISCNYVISRNIVLACKCMLMYYDMKEVNMKYTDGFKLCEKMHVYAAIGLLILGYTCGLPIFFRIAAGLFLGIATRFFVAWRLNLKDK